MILQQSKWLFPLKTTKIPFLFLWTFLSCSSLALSQDTLEGSSVVILAPASYIYEVFTESKKMNNQQFSAQAQALLDSASTS